MKEMINFTVGPVQANEDVLKVGGEQVPYFRTEEFSNVMFENERLVKKFAKASDDSKVVFLTGSGTAAMEASIINTLNNNDKALIVNGGSFGQRFIDLCQIYENPYDEIKLSVGETLTKEILDKYNALDYTTFIVNIHETSTGVHYDLDLIRDFCNKNDLFLIVDAISSFLADPIDMQNSKIDIMITSSQKSLACPPGISILVLSSRAVNKVYNANVKGLYFNLKIALENAKRGQTPFTPAVGILRQINTRLKSIDENGGVESEIKNVESLALYFRNNIKDLPFKLVTSSPSNAITALMTLTASANDIFLELKDHYNIWVCPNGGELKDKVFRVGHIGHLTKNDFDKLIDAFKDMQKRGLI